ncbi:MAG: 50S ribosomal protein L22 [Endomicrobium sp.]|jgi:large subunit ribosomal protein L22|nr:50S ribosomal protein L22 [Endomicrobium sp.]
MEAKATAKFVRCTPRKVNEVLALIRNKKIGKAFEILSFLPKSAAPLVEKVLKSAVANAGKLKDFSDFVVKEAWVGNGSMLKRMRLGSKGVGMPVKRRMAHITVVVAAAGNMMSSSGKKMLNIKK